MPTPSDPQSIGWIVLAIFGLVGGLNQVRALLRRDDPGNEPISRKQFEEYARIAAASREDMRTHVIQLEIQAARMKDAVDRIEHRLKGGE